MTFLFNPAIALMNRLKYPQKFLVIGLLLLPFGWVLSRYLAAANFDRDFAAKEQIGVTYLVPVTDLLQSLQTEMALGSAVQQGGSDFAGNLQEVQDEVEQAIADVDTVDQELGVSLGTTQRWTALKAEVELLHA